MRAALVAAVLLAGCALLPGARPMTEFTTPDLERARAECPRQNMIWCETQDEVRCVPRGTGHREKAGR